MITSVEVLLKQDNRSVSLCWLFLHIVHSVTNPLLFYKYHAIVILNTYSKRNWCNKVTFKGVLSQLIDTTQKNRPSENNFIHSKLNFPNFIFYIDDL